MLLYKTSLLCRISAFPFAARVGIVSSVAWSPDGKHLVAGYTEEYGGGWARIWEMATGKPVQLYRGHSDSIYAVSWSPDGTTIASGGEDHTVQLWNAATGKTLLTYHGHDVPVGALAWSPDGKYLASTDGDNFRVTSESDRTMQIWSASTGEHFWSYQGSVVQAWAVAWSPDGTRIAASLEDGVIRELKKR